MLKMIQYKLSCNCYTLKIFKGCDNVSKECNNCKNLQESVYMKLEDETLYNYWCEVGNIEEETCDKFVIKNNSNKNKSE